MRSSCPCELNFILPQWPMTQACCETLKLLFLFAWSFSFVLNYETDINNDHFRINISAKCRDGAMMIKLETESPFYGTIHTYGREEICYAAGEQNRETNFVVSLTDLVECGIHYEWVFDLASLCGCYTHYLKEQEHYWVIVVVRQHRWIVTDNDKMFNVSCTTGRNPDVRHGQPEFKVALVEKEHPLKRAHFGKTYHLKVWTTNESYLHFNVVECEAYSGKNYSLLLTGNNVEHGLVSPFRYDGNVAIADFLSMFRFVHNKLVHFQCIIEYQDNNHPINFDIFAAASGIRSAPAVGDTKRQRFQALTSTTVMVAPTEYEPGLPMYPDCDNINFIQLSLCVILATIFAIEATAYWHLKTKEGNDRSVCVKISARNDDDATRQFRGRKFAVSPDNVTENHDSGCDCCSLYEVPSRLP